MTGGPQDPSPKQWAEAGSRSPDDLPEDEERAERIRRRAHQIWEEEGRPNGREREHWERAEREVG